MEEMVGLEVATKHLDFLDPGGSDSIAEFEKETWSREDIALDGSTTPGAAVNGNSEGSLALAIEPAPGYSVEILPYKADGISRILGQDHDPVPVSQVALVHGFQLLAVIDKRTERPGCYSPIERIIADGRGQLPKLQFLIASS